jgi:putative ABC transport system substrate-binding protein
MLMLGGGMVALQAVARAQQPTMPVIGFLSGRSPGESASHLDAFRQGLGEVGYWEGRNVAIEYRWAEGHPDRLPALADDLVARQVAVIAATGGNHAALAAKALTTSIPIVFTSGADPVRVGLVASLNRPAGNVTGVSWFSGELVAKRLGLLHEVAPNAAVIGLIENPEDPEAEPRPTAQEAARALGLRLLVLQADSESEIDAAFATLAQQQVGALVVGAGPFFLSRRNQIVGLAARHALPAIFTGRDFPTAGGLISYGNDLSDAYRRAGVYTGRILKSVRPADLPIDRSTKFELVINMKTAGTLGLRIPPELLASADEVIE